MEKIQSICSLMLLTAFLGCMPMLHAQSYDSLWKQVESAQKKSLPQTAVKLTDEIFRKGEQDKNTPQMLKAYTCRRAYQDMLTPDSFYVNLKGLEQWAVQEQNTVSRAVLHSLIANIYADYAAGNRWQLRQRTSLDVEDGALPEDIREWSGNLFARQVMQHAAEALKDSTELLNTSSRTFIPFVVLGDASEYYHHDMYHLLASRAVDALLKMRGFDSDTPIEVSINGIYERMIRSYRTMPDREDAAVLTILKYWEWRSTTNVTPLLRIATYDATKGQDLTPYLSTLNYMIKEYAGRDVCAEVYLAKAQYYRDRGKNVEALQACDEAIKLYPRYERISALRNLKDQILQSRLNVSTDKIAYPGGSLSMRVDHKNLAGFTVHLLRTTLSAPVANMPVLNADFYKKYTHEVKTEHFSLVRSDNYESATDTINILLPEEPGIYVVQVVADGANGQSSNQYLYITRFKVLTMSLPDKKSEMVVLDSKTGTAVSGADVLFYSADMDKMRKEPMRRTTDARGKVMVTQDASMRALVARKGEDTGMPFQSVYFNAYSGWQSARDVASNSLKLLTDRALYRPGQTIYVKGIAYTQIGDTADVAPNEDYEISLRDVNRREIAKKEVRTNEFGSFTLEFMLPAACLNGRYSIETSRGRSNASVSIQVEEYKRPTFDIVFDPQKASYQIGDSVQVKGLAKTFSGVPLQGVELTYRITRNVYSWWGIMGGGTSLTSGSVLTGDGGDFAIPVHLEGDDNSSNSYYTYQIEASVTSLSGETQTAATTLAAGNRSLVLSVDGEELICKDDSVKQTFFARNLNGEPVSVEGQYRLVQVLNGDSLVRISGEFTSNVETQLPQWKELPSGTYELQLNAKDVQGRSVDFKKAITLFSYNDNRPVVATDLWYYARNVEFDATHPAQFSIGTSLKDVYVMVDVFSGKGVLKSTALQLSDSIVRFDVPYLEEYGDGVEYLFTFVKNGDVYSQQVALKKRLPNKTLTMKWEVFRDKLLPGQQEEWRLTIKNPQGNAPVAAEMLATMYDASLDKIYPNYQTFSLNYPRRIPVAYWRTEYDSSLYYYYNSPLQNRKVSALVYDSFYEAASGIFYQQSVQVRGAATDGDVKIAYTPMVADEEHAIYSMAETGVEMKYVPAVAKMSQAKQADDTTLQPADVELRTNFAETAFFYPQLRTNKRGEVSFAFTMPQSLTRWNFRGYAHTKGMLTGMLNASTVTAKEFMLAPNMPRFVRAGDKTSIAATLTNLTGKELKGTTTFTLFDPMTDKVISTQRRQFTVAAGKSAPVSFKFTITDKYDLLGVRMVADGGTFSDGEQHLLPVLDNKMYITETLAMPVRGEQTRTFSLDSLFNYNNPTATDRRLTVEFTGNPAWYAVQALPTLSQPGTNSATAWAAAYYANSLASYIVNRQPRIKAVFDSWRMQGDGSKETFLSRLQKNQEVKNILLAETPWLMEATTEAEQRARIATLFDLNNLSNNNMTALTKLQELQEPDGAWSWYKGMPGSRSMTEYITELLVRLPVLTGKQQNPSDVRSMQQKAFGYLHNQALEEYKNIRKAEKAGAKFTTLSRSAMQYLYLVALSGEKVPAANNDAYRYFLSMVEKNLTSSAMGLKAQSAIVLQKAGRTTEANAFIASLKEHLVQTDERGAYFAFYETPYVWGMQPVSVQVEVMEALRLAGGNDALVEEMKLWLLKQKQATSWDSPVTTADAVYALLCQGIDLLAPSGDVRITLGKKVLETSQSDVPGLSYIKESYAQGSAEVKAKSVTVEKRDAGIAWGAVYAQYLSPISDVKQQGGELAVEKQLYVERTLADGKKELQPIADATQLAVGDKVVSRLTIRLDRAMDFVQLKDQRGACFEPIDALSGYRWNGGTGYYVEIEDASTNFFFDGLGKGVYVLEYSYRVSRSGQYEAGLATIQSAYAPEYTAHSASSKVTVE